MGDEDTIRKALHLFMINGLKVDYGEKIGKDMIFAKNHRHAQKTFEVLGQEFPRLSGYAEVVDNQINDA